MKKDFQYIKQEIKDAYPYNSELICRFLALERFFIFDDSDIGKKWINDVMKIYTNKYFGDIIAWEMHDKAGLNAIIQPFLNHVRPKTKNKYSDCIEDAKLEYPNYSPLAQQFLALELVFMVENNAIGRRWQRDVAKVLVDKYRGNILDWEIKDKNGLTNALQTFVDYLLL